MRKGAGEDAQGLPRNVLLTQRAKVTFAREESWSAEFGGRTGCNKFILVAVFQLDKAGQHRQIVCKIPRPRPGAQIQSLHCATALAAFEMKTFGGWAEIILRKDGFRNTNHRRSPITQIDSCVEQALNGIVSEYLLYCDGLLPRV